MKSHVFLTVELDKNEAQIALIRYVFTYATTTTRLQRFKKSKL
jgi:hypothetical protein